MRPIFEQGTFSQQLVDPLRLVIPKTAPQYQVRAACYHVNRIDLEVAHAPNGVENVGFGRWLIWRLEEALSRQHHVSGHLNRDFICHKMNVSQL